MKHYTVYTIGGSDVGIDATEMKIDEAANRLTFSGEKGEWIFFLSAVAGIHSKDKSLGVTFAHFRM